MEKNQVDVENAQVVPRDDYVQTLEEILAAGFCPFCREHFFKHHRKPIRHETSHWFVTENTWAYAGTLLHLLFITERHVERIEDLTAEELLDLHRLYKEIVEKEKLVGATLFIRSGEMSITGASVTHLHAHLVVGGPRTETAKPIKALIGFETEE